MTLVEIPTPARSAGRRRVPWHRIQVTAKCWLWTGPVWKRYGKSGGTTAHRHVWLALGRTIPTGLELDHLCRVPLCVNPDHLEPVTRAENARRRSLAQVTCINGHDYTPENTYTRPDGSRDCRICVRARVAKYRRGLSLRKLGGQVSDRLGDVHEGRAQRMNDRNVRRSGALLQRHPVVGEIASDGQELFGVKGHARTLSGVTR